MVILLLISDDSVIHAYMFTIILHCMCVYINNSLHLVRKYARIFVRWHYLFREVNSFPRAKLEENCELRGTDNVQGQISVHIFEDKWRLLCLLSFKYFSHSRAREYHLNWGISLGYSPILVGAYCVT